MKFKNSLFAKSFSSTEASSINNHSLKEFIRLLNLNSPKLKKIESLLSGKFSSIQTGSGYDFNEIREYKIGDDLRHISWNATAKTGTLHTKEYYAEKEVKTYFLIDISNSMLCGNKLSPLIQLFAFLLNISCGFSEKVGGLFFSDDIKYNFPMAQSSSQANIMFQSFLNIKENFKDKITNFPCTTNLSRALELTKKHFCKKGLIILISDFIGLTNWEKSIYNATVNQNIYSFQIYDPVDYELPKSGYVAVVDPETHSTCFVNTDSSSIRKAYNDKTNKRQEELEIFLKKLGVIHTKIEKNDFD